jgi:hypothetical protein
VFPEHAEKQSVGWRRAVGWAIKVQKTVGPERLEQIYEDRLSHEMALNGLGF